MNSLRIGKNTFYYSTTKEILYKVTKEYYFDNVKLFDPVRSKNEEDKEKSIYVDIINGYKESFFKMSSDTMDIWKTIIDELKIKYKESETEEVICHINKDSVDDYNEVLSKHIEKVKKIKPSSIIGKLLKYSPIDDLGYSKPTFFSTFDVVNDAKLIPNNGVQWDRQVKNYFEVEYYKERGSTVGYRFIGFNLQEVRKTRQIRTDIRKAFDDAPCVHCWTPNKTHKKHEIDHKNGRYDDNQVLNTESQEINHFQTLCREHNLLKRSACKKCKVNNIRFDATFLGYQVSVTEGTLKYDDKLGCRGCYLYDPLDFKSQLFLKIKSNDEIQ
jgi:hypothetical protein